MHADRWEDEVLLPTVRLHLGARKDCVFFRNATGLAESMSGGKVRYGLCKGGSDLIGFVRPSGRLVTLELKAPGGRESDDQKRFRALVNLGGGYSRVIEAPDKTKEGLAQALVLADEAVDEAIRTACRV